MGTGFGVLLVSEGVETFGEWLTRVIEELGLSQTQVGEALGVSQQSVSKYVGPHSRALPRSNRIVPLSRLTGYTTDQILERIMNTDALPQEAEIRQQAQEAERRLRALTDKRRLTKEERAEVEELRRLLGG
jgi:transcriptional regulator with XRE-family HTH domain